MLAEGEGQGARRHWEGAAMGLWDLQPCAKPQTSMQD